jgi:phosphopantothenoylcysteine decarboxylase/phosphopantothenate--cysteine ligase
MRIVVGITGGIAAYKSVSLVRLFVEAGHDVKVIPTQNALRFVGATTLEAISKNSVDPDLYTDVESVKHVELGQQADLIVVAPATASFMARLAAGIADDLLMNTILASTSPLVIAPAMHTEMWQHAATQANLKTLLARGVRVVGPNSGRLTGEDTGVGRMAEPSEIFEEALSNHSLQDLTGKVVVVTAGGTRESIDGVRFIGNRSSGKQGLAIAKRASDRGARVFVIGANVSEDIPFDHANVSSVAELKAALIEQLPRVDVLVMAAAVSDYQVKNPSTKKLKKSDHPSMSLELEQTEDLLASSTKWLRANRPNAFVVGFAAETLDDDAKLLEVGLGKLVAKGCNLIVANDVSGGSVFDSTHTSALIIEGSGLQAKFAGSKLQLADRVLDAVVSGSK